MVDEVPPLGWSTILLDPPWPERGGGKSKRGADRHYPLINKKEEILRVIMQSGVWQPATDCHMYMWITNNYLNWGLWLIEALGFQQKTNFPWVKPGSAGIGQYAMGHHELLFFCVRGRGYAIRSDDRKITTSFLVGAECEINPKTGKRRHSAKPPAQYTLIERRTLCPEGTGRLEMFARNRQPGWSSWGNEV